MRRAVVLATLGLLVAGGAAAKEIKVGLRDIPPYVIRQGDQFAGLDYDIIAGALAQRGHSLTVILLPYARLTRPLQENPEIDAAAPVLGGFNVGGTISNPYLTYHNIALSLAKTGVQLASIQDLRRYRVIAFQKAHLALGPDLQAIADGNPAYREEANLLPAIRALYFERTDVVVGDRRIIRHFIDDLGGEIDLKLGTVEHLLFAPVDFSAAFRDPLLAADFNEGLQALKRSGAYAVLLRKY